MKAYLIGPPFETYGDKDERTSAATNLVAEIVFECLRRGGDTFQYSVVWANPGDDPGGIYNADIAVPHVFRLETDDALWEWLRRSVDPNASGGGDVRSIATCRTVTFGYDGQALLCLRHEDAPPVSSDLTLATVEERPDFLGETDYFDGWIKASRIARTAANHTNFGRSNGLGLIRHCERSEAIQSGCERRSGLPRRLRLLAMTGVGARSC